MHALQRQGCSSIQGFVRAILVMVRCLWSIELKDHISGYLIFSGTIFTYYICIEIVILAVVYWGRWNFCSQELQSLKLHRSLLVAYEAKIICLAAIFLIRLDSGSGILNWLPSQKLSQLRKRRTEAWNYFQNKELDPLQMGLHKKRNRKTPPIIQPERTSFREQWIDSRERNHFLFNNTGVSIKRIIDIN